MWDAIYKIQHSAYTDCFAVDSANLFLHGEYVQQCLCRVFTNSIASIDNRLPRVLGCHLLQKSTTTCNIITWLQQETGVNNCCICGNPDFSKCIQMHNNWILHTLLTGSSVRNHSSSVHNQPSLLCWQYRHHWRECVTLWQWNKNSRKW